MADVELTVNGRVYRGWTSIRVTRGLEAIAGSFDLSVSERWSGQNDPWPIVDGDACTVAIAGFVDPVITGYVDVRGHRYDAQAHVLSVSGRDKTADLVDCSAVLSAWEFQHVSVPEFCAKLAKPFGIEVTVQPGLALTDRIEKLVVNPGDTAFDVIDRVCRMVAALPVPDGRGGLQLTRANVTVRTTTALVEGENVIAASVQYDSSRRFRSYIVLGQRAGSNEGFGETVSRIKATASDDNVTRAARVLLIRPEGVVTPKSAAARAQWEAKIRAARSAAFTVTVQGWTQGDGTVWPFNVLAPVRIPTLGVDTELLITQTEFGLSVEDGTTTRLTLMSKDAFLPEPVIAKRSETGGSGLSFLGS